jgi:D-methionine transport system permease protein
MITSKIVALIPKAFCETLFMMGVTCFCAFVIGFLVGLYLYFVDQKILKKTFLFKVSTLCVDSIRAFPFAIFIIALLPVSKFLLGSSFGIKAAFLPMILASSAYFARLCHQTFHNVSSDMIHVCVLMGFSKKDLALRLIFKETLPYTILNLSLLANAACGFSTMAGLIGAGGLGKLALDYGYYRFNISILLINIFIILLIGASIQYLGEFFFKKLMKKRGLYAKS